MKCPKCSAPIHPIQRRCNNCATRVAFCKFCKTINLLEKQVCQTCHKTLVSTKNFQQLEAEYYQKRQEVAIRFVCICGKTISVALNQAGKTGKCPKCGYKILVPTPNSKRSSQQLDPISLPAIPKKSSLHKETLEKKLLEKSPLDLSSPKKAKKIEKIEKIEKPLFYNDLFTKVSPENNPSEPTQIPFSDDIFAPVSSQKEHSGFLGEFSIFPPLSSKKSDKISKPKIKLRLPDNPSTENPKNAP